MDDFEAEIKREFISEALLNLEEAESSFMELETSADPKSLLDKIFRLAHNLKGGSRAVGFGDIAEFTHQLENLVLKIQQDQVALNGSVITTLLKANDRLVEMLVTTKSNGSATFDNSDLIAELVSSTLASATSAVVEVTQVVEPNQEDEPTQEAEPTLEADEEIETAAPVPTADSFTEPVSPQIAVIQKPVAQPAPTESNQGRNNGKEDEVVRVNLSKIDLLNDFVGELIVVQSVIQQQGDVKLSNRIEASLQQMVKISKDIQSLSMSLRMLPVKPLIQKLQRVVRDTSTLLKKEIDLEVIGDQIEIDKSVLDRLADPLIHVLRNAVDHGIEPNELRVAAGKKSTGRIELSLINEGNHLIVTIRDDGNGIDSKAVRKKALEKGLITETQALSEKQLINLIFHPGFSTKTVTSETSGRGVGMDVVKTNIDRMGGQIEITTQAGQGSVFRLKIPLSLAVIEGWIVNATSNRFVIPASQIQETLSLKKYRLYPDKTGIGTCIELRGTVIPLFDIDESLGAKASPITEDDTVMIIAVNDQLLGMAVRAIVKSQQVVIKPNSFGVRPRKGWIGSCVLGDGLPTLIISPVDLLEGKIVLGTSDTLQGNT